MAREKSISNIKINFLIVFQHLAKRLFTECMESVLLDMPKNRLQAPVTVTTLDPRKRN